MKSKLIVAATIFTTLWSSTQAQAADPVENNPTPTPAYEQKAAVDGYHVGFGGTAGVVADQSLYLGTVSMSSSIPFIDSLGIQLDLTAGEFDGNTAASSGLHIFWRDPSIGMIGAYGDWAYRSPQHAGRVGAEFAVYLDRFTVDGVVGGGFGQDIETRFFDEVDLSYYITDDLRASIGHRWASHGHIGNAAIEWKLPIESSSVKLYAEGEIGEDDYNAAFAGLRISFGSAAPKSLIEEDRENNVRTRTPRNFASISYCTNKSDNQNIYCGTKKEVDRRRGL